MARREVIGVVLIENEDGTPPQLELELADGTLVQTPMHAMVPAGKKAPAKKAPAKKADDGTTAD